MDKDSDVCLGCEFYDECFDNDDFICVIFEHIPEESPETWSKSDGNELAKTLFEEYKILED